MNVYQQIKNMPNPSKGLLGLFKKTPSGKVWAVGEDGQTLKDLRKMKLSEMNLKVGEPDNALIVGNGYVRGRVFSGIMNLRRSMFFGYSPRDNRGYLVGLGKKGKGVYMVDVTDRMIQELNQVGACTISEAHCKFNLKGKTIKECQFCKRKLKRKRLVEVTYSWSKAR